MNPDCDYGTKQDIKLIGDDLLDQARRIAVLEAAVRKLMTPEGEETEHIPFDIAPPTGDNNTSTTIR